MPRLVLVCNRANPPQDAGGGTLGGVPVALAAALRESHGIWFGWSGRAAKTYTATPRLSEISGLSVASFDLAAEDVAEYYDGYANNALWQAFHFQPAAYDSPSLAGYERLNARFAAALRPLLRKDDIVWAHDYQLIFLARELRRLGVENPIGFFLHIPWPPRQLLAMLPQHRRLVAALFSYDLAGFHTEEWRVNFADYARTEFAAADDDGRIAAFGRTLSTGVFPAGIDARGFAAAAREPEARAAFAAAQAELHGRRLIVGVDRLDYPKGLEERLSAFAHWLAANEKMRGAVLYHQIAPAMTDATTTYRAVRRRVRASVRRINRRFGNGVEPVRFTNRMHRRHELAGLYRAASVGLVTPLCDGMNLVAKEYVAAQDGKDPGVLVLSRFAGAAAELTSALLVNPFARAEVADALSAALAMGLRERRARWEELMHIITAHDASHWVKSFLSKLARCTQSNSGADRTLPSPRPGMGEGRTSPFWGGGNFA